MRFPLVVAVVVLHNLSTTAAVIPTDLTPGGLDWARFFMCNAVARSAVPLLTLFSGYLFFHRFDGTLASYRAKLGARVRSLLVPLLLWNIAVSIAMAIGQILPSTRGFFNPANPPIADLTAWQYVEAILGLGRAPLAYPFWFVRNLFLACVLSPLLDRGLKTFGVGFCLTLTALWAADIPIVAGLRIEYTLAFFVWGGWLQQRQLDLTALDCHWKKIGVGYGVLATVWTTFALQYGTEGLLWPGHRLLVVAGVVAGWTSFSKIQRLGPWTRAIFFKAGPLAFFIFAMHEPALCAVSRLTQKVLGPINTGTAITLMIAPVLIVVLVGLGLALGLRRRFPRFYRLICGQRFRRPTPVPPTVLSAVST